MIIALVCIAVPVLLVVAGALAVRALGGNVELIDDWKKSWKFYSSYVLAGIAALPELYNQTIALHWLSGPQVPPIFAKVLWAITGLGFAGRLLKQAKRPPLPDFNDRERGS